LDLGTVEPTVAGPKRPQDRVALRQAKTSFTKVVEGTPAKHVAVRNNGDSFDLSSGAVVIAAITSCTNTSNPSLMLGAGLLAKKAVERGLRVKPWVKTSLAPGSKVVTDYLLAAGLTPYLEKLNFTLSAMDAPLASETAVRWRTPSAPRIKDNNLIAVAVLSGNRNFEGRIHPLVRRQLSGLPPLVVAYACLRGAWTLTSPRNRSATTLAANRLSERYLADAARNRINRSFFRYYGANTANSTAKCRRRCTLEVHADSQRRYLQVGSEIDLHQAAAVFRKHATALRRCGHSTAPRCWPFLGDSVTTDHISPAGSIPWILPAGKYLIANG